MFRWESYFQLNFILKRPNKTPEHHFQNARIINLFAVKTIVVSSNNSLQHKIMILDHQKYKHVSA